MPKIKRLLIDIEVSPNIGFFWQSGYKLNIGYENIIHERAIICVCYKWEGEKRVYSLRWDAKKSDKSLLKELVPVLDQATELVMHNGDSFDLKWIRTRALLHGLKMTPRYVTIDTLKYARSRFRFNSNRLDYLAKFLGIGAKVHTGFDLWKSIVLDKSEPAMKKMIRYCKGDVILLEKVFEKMKNHLPAKTHVTGVKIDCPECGGRTKISKTRLSAGGVKTFQRSCNSCGKYHTSSI